MNTETTSKLISKFHIGGSPIDHLKQGKYYTNQNGDLIFITKSKYESAISGIFFFSETSLPVLFSLNAGHKLDSDIKSNLMTNWVEIQNLEIILSPGNPIDYCPQQITDKKLSMYNMYISLSKNEIIYMNRHDRYTLLYKSDESEMDKYNIIQNTCHVDTLPDGIIWQIFEGEVIFSTSP